MKRYSNASTPASKPIREKMSRPDGFVNTIAKCNIKTQDLVRIVNEVTVFS